MQRPYFVVYSNKKRCRGLAQQLTTAGSESQMMSLWQVGDFATKELMVKYYQRVLDNQVQKRYDRRS